MMAGDTDDWAGAAEQDDACRNRLQLVQAYISLTEFGKQWSVGKLPFGRLADASARSDFFIMHLGCLGLQ